MTSGLLDDGPRLERAEGLFANDPHIFNSQERAFVLASRARRNELARRRRRTIRTIVTVLLLATVVSVVGGWIAWVQRGRALRERDIADARRLATQALSTLERHPARSLLLAIEAMGVAYRRGVRVVDAENALRQILSTVGGTALSGHGGPINVAAISLDGTWVATGGDDRTAHLWRLGANGDVLGTIVLRGHAGPVTFLAFSADQRWLVTGNVPHYEVRRSALGTPPETLTLQVWDLQAADPSRSGRAFPVPVDSVTSVAASADGEWLATGMATGETRLWRLSSPNPTERPVLLRGHSGEVTSVALSVRGEWLASGGADRGVRVWRLDHGAPVDSFTVGPAGKGRVSALAFDPRNRVLFVGTGLQETGNVIARNGDAAVHHLSLERGGQRVRVSVTGEDEVTRLSVSPDGRWLAALSYTGFPANTRRDRAAKTLRVWSLASSDTAAVRSLAGLGATTITAAFSTDSRWLATGGSDRAVRLWRLDGSAPLLRPMELRGHENTVTAVQSSGRWLVSGSADARARVWPIDAASPFTEPRVLDGHGNGTRAADFSHDGRWLVTLGGFNELRIWDLRRPNPWQAPVRLHEGSYRIRSVRMTPDSRWVITDLDLDGETFLWRVGHGGVARVPVRLPGAVLAVAPSGRWVATGGLDRPTYLWDLASDRPEQGREPLRVRVRAGVQQMVFSPDGRQLLAVGYDSTAWVWTTQENKWTEARSLGTQDRFARYAFTSDGSRLVGVGQEAVRLLSLKSATTTASRVIADSVIPLFDAEVSPDGQWLLTGMWEQGLLSKTGADRWLRLYDLVRGPQGERSTILVGHRHKVTAVAFSGDGRWLATGSEDSTVHLRELRPGSEGAPPIVLRGAEATILALRFSPDSRRLLATGQDNLARAWYVEEPQEPPVLLAGHKTEVDVVEVSPDGRWVVTGGDDDEARLWRLDTRHLVEVACRVAGRNLTPDEWAEYLPSRNPAATCPALPFTVAAAPTPRPPRQRGGVRQDGIPLAPTRRRTRRKRPDHLFLHLQRGAHRCPDCQRQTGTPC